MGGIGSQNTSQVLHFEAFVELFAVAVPPGCVFLGAYCPRSKIRALRRCVAVSVSTGRSSPRCATPNPCNHIPQAKPKLSTRLDAVCAFSSVLSTRGLKYRGRVVRTSDLAERPLIPLLCRCEYAHTCPRRTVEQSSPTTSLVRSRARCICDCGRRYRASMRGGERLHGRSVL